MQKSWLPNSFLFVCAGLALAALFWMLQNRSTKAPVSARIEPSVLEKNQTPNLPSQNVPFESRAAPSEEVALRMQTLKAILASKNDNDPRLDSEFRSLSPELKNQLKAYYSELPPEALNAKGTLVFLISRNFDPSQDVEFWEKVIVEPACENLLQCLNGTPSVEGESHGESAVTLAYPQIVALQTLQGLWSRIPDEKDRERLRAALQFASRSPNRALSGASQQLLKLVP